MVFYAVIAAVVLIVAFAGVYFLHRRKGERRYYKPKGDFILSRGEKAFFDVLLQSIDPALYVCPKVRIADLITINIDESDKQYWTKLNKITQKHVDFVICNRSDFHPLLVIELDGGSHNDPKRAMRDEEVDQAFKEAGIPILHMQAQSMYNAKDLASLIFAAMNPPQSTDQKNQ